VKRYGKRNYPAVLQFLEAWNDAARPGEPKQVGLSGEGTT